MGFVLPGSGSGGAGGDGKPFTSDDLVNLVIQSMTTVAGSEEVILRTEDGLRIATPKKLLMQALDQYASALTGDEEVIIRTPLGPARVALSTLKSFVALDPKKVRVKRRLLTRLSDGGDHHLFSASGSASQQTLLGIVKANFLTSAEASLAIAEHIDCKVWVCGGGGGGGYNNAAAYGGHPGNLTIREFKLSEVPTTAWSFQVGSGGSAGNVGGASYFGPNGTVCHAYAQGGWPGGQGQANQSTFFELMKSYGSDRVMGTHLGDTTSDWVANAPHGWVGPGGGGSIIWALRRGGNGSVGSKGNLTQGSVETSASSSARTFNAPKGADHNPLYADSWGAGGGCGLGGAQGSAGLGAGGFPGGGGGGSNLVNPATVAWGGNGAIKIQFWLTTVEIVA